MGRLYVDSLISVSIWKRKEKVRALLLMPMTRCLNGLRSINITEPTQLYSESKNKTRVRAVDLSISRLSVRRSPLRCRRWLFLFIILNMCSL